MFSKVFDDLFNIYVSNMSKEITCSFICSVCVCRTESVAEKMLTNWFTFLLYKFLKVTDIFVFNHTKLFHYNFYCFIGSELGSQSVAKDLKGVKKFYPFKLRLKPVVFIHIFFKYLDILIVWPSELCRRYGAERLHSSLSLFNPLSRSVQVNHSFPSSVPSSSRWKKALLTPSQERRATHSVRTSSSGNRLTTRRW